MIKKYLKEILLLAFIYHLIIFVSAEESINIEYPELVSTGKEFEFSVILNGFGEAIYDIKIDFIKDGKRLSKIWNGNSWQSTFKYLADSIDTSSLNKKAFRINISEEVY